MNKLIIIILTVACFVYAQYNYNEFNNNELMRTVSNFEHEMRMLDINFGYRAPSCHVSEYRSSKYGNEFWVRCLREGDAWKLPSYFEGYHIVRIFPEGYVALYRNYK